MNDENKVLRTLTDAYLVRLWADRSDGPDNAEIVSYARAVLAAAGAQPRTLMDAAEIECYALSAWHLYWRSLYMTDGYDEVPAQFLAAFRAGYAAAERTPPAGMVLVATVGDLIIQVRERVTAQGILNSAPLYAAQQGQQSAGITEGNVNPPTNNS